MIREINRTPIRSTADYEKLTAQLKQDENVLLLVNREGGALFLSVRV